MNKRALITGIGGQDGAYLARFLRDKGYDILGTHLPGKVTNFWRLEYLEVTNDLQLAELDLRDQMGLDRIIRTFQPDEIYNLAAQSYVGSSFAVPVNTLSVNTVGVAAILEIIRAQNQDIRLFQASSSEIFGNAQEVPQTEQTALQPVNPYGISKMAAHLLVGSFRSYFDLYTVCGVLFNHESPLRDSGYVSKKIARTVAEIKRGRAERLTLGNIHVRRDWGFAGDYVQAMWLALQQSAGDDYLIASGETWSIKDFVELAFEVVDIHLTWSGEGLNEVARDRRTQKVVVDISPAFFREVDVYQTLGLPQKAQDQLGWVPDTDFSELVELMVEYECRQLDNPGMG